MPLRFLSELDTLESELDAGFALPRELTAAEVVKPDVLSCSPDTPLREAAAAMQARRCSSILVVDGESPLGIWTERDALSAELDTPNMLDAPIREVMSTPVITIAGSMLLREVAPYMRGHGLRHLLVVDANQQPLGILSQTDVVLHQGIEHYLQLRAVGTVVRRDVPRLSEDVAVSELRRHMRSERSDAALIEYRDGRWGILTERDLVSLIAQSPQPNRAGELASYPLLTVSSDTSLYRARTLLTEQGVRHLGVTDGAELLGLVSFAEIMSGIEVAYVHELQQALRVRDRALVASRRSLHLAERILESTLEGVMITDPDGRIVSVNPAFTRLTGYSEEEVLGKTPRMLSSGRHDEAFYENLWRELSAHGHWQGEIWNRKKSGEPLPEYLSITAIRNESGAISHYVGMFNDITELKEQEQKVRNLAYRDALTGLPNRRLLDDRLNMALAHARRQGSRVGLLFIDLDHFKQINDALGHAAGDTLLVEVAQRLQACVREDDTVARLAGDEFVIILTTIDSIADAERSAERVLQRLREPIRLAERDVRITCSLGISVYPDNGESGDALLQHADKAMYQIKALGRDGFGNYETPQREAGSVYR